MYKKIIDQTDVYKDLATDSGTQVYSLPTSRRKTRIYLFGIKVSDVSSNIEIDSKFYLQGKDDKKGVGFVKH